MKLPQRGRDGLIVALLAVLPAMAYAPALFQQRLMGQGDAAVLHFPLRAAVWDSYHRGELPFWNPGIFCGTPLLAAYRPGALSPLMMALSPVPSFPAFQALVLISMSLAAVLCYCYLRRLGASAVGSYLGGLSFSLGPYVVGHPGDTPTLVGTPAILLALLAAEAHLEHGPFGRPLALAGALALLLLAGSPEAVVAGGWLVIGRLAIGHLFPKGSRTPSPLGSAAAVLFAGFLAAPQLLPTLHAVREAGRSTAGLVKARTALLEGASGLVLRYVSHTPAPSLALAALPLFFADGRIRVLALASALCLALRWGRGPLSAPGGLSLAFDLLLCLLAGISFSAQWQARHTDFGRRLRGYFLLACVASAVALSVSAAVLRGLPQTLAGCVGVLALSLILYFGLAHSPSPARAGLFLLPLTVSFVLQPQGRGAWAFSPTRDELEKGTPTREALESVMGLRRADRTLTLASSWPSDEVFDLAWADLGLSTGRLSANGYDPFVSTRTRAAFDTMNAGGVLPARFFRTDPSRLEAFGVRWVQVPLSSLETEGASGLGDALDIVMTDGEVRLFPLPIRPATEVRIASFLSDSIAVKDHEPVAWVEVLLSSGRSFSLPLRAGRHTSEWAYDRPDVRKSVAHGFAPVFDSFHSGSFEGHRYLGILPFPGRYLVEGLRVRRVPGRGSLTLVRLGTLDARSGRSTPVSLASGFVSDTALFREAAATPAVRLFEMPRGGGLGRVAERLLVLPSKEAVLQNLRYPRRAGIDLRREALAESGEAPPVEGGHSSRAEAVPGASSNRLELRAQGPGLLVVAEAWDEGWSARLDGQDAVIHRVNHFQMGVVLPAGVHILVLEYRAPGFVLGILLAAATGAGLGLLVLFRRLPLASRKI